MLSFSQVKSAGSAGNYYTEKDNYYVIGSMEERWQGKGRKRWGWREGGQAGLHRAAAGKLPDGSDLTRMQDGVNKHRPGYDLTFSAPKSVSMLAMLGEISVLSMPITGSHRGTESGGIAGINTGTERRRVGNSADRQSDYRPV
jgi:hypothetical protein